MFNHRVATALAAVVMIGSPGCTSSPRTTENQPAAPAPEPPPSPTSPMGDPVTAAWVSAGQPSEHHRHLDVLVGEFDVVFELRGSPEAPWQKYDGLVRREWILGGRYMKEEVDAQGDAGHFKGLGFVAYNNIDGQYEIVWMDVQSTGIMRETGTFDATRKIFSTRSAMRDAYTGQLIIGRGESNLSNPDRHTYSGYAIGENGSEYECFRGTLERKK